MNGEHSTRYWADINLAQPNDSHALAIGRVPARSDVLDLGAADGSIASVLSRMDCRIWGVEYDAVAARDAQNWCEAVVVADINTLSLPEAFPGQDFDIVLMLDILEHLVDPTSVLRKVRDLLRPTGWAVISLPNVAHISVRLALLRGQFTYTDLGLLDRTHLRFFDPNGVHELLRSAGWIAFDVARVTRRLGTTEIEVGDDVDPQLVMELERDPDALTYQFVIAAAPEGSPVLERPPLLPAAIAQDALLSLNPQGERVIAGPTYRELWNELQRIRDASSVRRNHLRHLVENLRENSERISSTLEEIGRP